MEHKEYRLAAVMFTDIVGFSRMMESDEAGTLKLLDAHNGIVRESTDRFGGRTIKTIGDAFLVEFTSTVNAVNCAVDIQRRLAARNLGEDDRAKPGLAEDGLAVQGRLQSKEQHGTTQIVLRIGIHLGDIYFFEDDALGEGINIASRLQSLAQPGRICISGDVYNLVAGKVEGSIRSVGPVKLKNISREIVAYEVNPDPSPQAEEPQSEEGSAAASTGTDDQASAKELILAEVKHAGRRLTADEVRAAFPRSRPGIDEAIAELVGRGILKPATGRGSVDLGRPTRRYTGHDEPHARREHPAPLRRDEAPQRPVSLPVPPAARGTGDDREDKENEERWDEVLLDDTGAGTGDPIIAAYREQTGDAADRTRASLMGHGAAYLGVQVLLFVLWMTSGTAFPWFLIPMFAWGIGIAGHWNSARMQRIENDDLKKRPNLTRRELRVLRKLSKARKGWFGHLVSTISTSALLAVINLITTPFPWALIPIGAMGVGLLGHLPMFRSKRRRLEQELIAAEAAAPNPAASPEAGAEPRSAEGPAAQQALRVRDAIRRQLATMGDAQPLGSDFDPLLDEYVAQIVGLERKDAEIGALIDSLPVSDAEAELVRLRRERDASSNRSIQAEYDRSIEQVVRQQESLNRLHDEKARLGLRLTSSINTLKQVQIDLARMRSLDAPAGTGGTALLRDKTTELSRFLDDLHTGYEEVERLQSDSVDGFSLLEGESDTAEGKLPPTRGDSSQT